MDGKVAGRFARPIYDQMTVQFLHFEPSTFDAAVFKYRPILVLTTVQFEP